MAVQKQVFYFQQLNDPDTFAEVLGADGIGLTRLDYDMPRAQIDRVLAASQGYQIQNQSRIARENGYGVDRALLDRCPDLLVVSTPGSGYDAVNLDDCTAAGVLAVNQAGLHAEAVAEHALGMMLCLSKCIMRAHTDLHGERNWSRIDHAGRDIHGKTLGILGFGAIGRRLTDICRGAFDMRVLTHHPRRTDAQIREAGAEPAPFDRVLAEADFVVAILPLTAETRGMFGAREFAMMKDSAYFINVGRGEVCKIDDLADAIESCQIAGCGLDVFEEEPLPREHKLWGLPNVLLTPHVAVRDAGNIPERRYEVLIGNARRFLDNEPLANVVDKTRWY